MWRRSFKNVGSQIHEACGMIITSPIDTVSVLMYTPAINSVPVESIAHEETYRLVTKQAENHSIVPADPDCKGAFLITYRSKNSVD